LEYAKSLAGQQEDLDKLKEESSEQSNQISETLAQVAQDESEWKEAHLKELSTLMEKFDQATGKASDNILAQTLQEDKTLTEIAKEQKKVDWDKLISGIQGAAKKPIENVKVVSETKIVEKKIEPEKQATAPAMESPKKEEKPKADAPSAEKSVPEKPLPEKAPQEKLPKDELSPVIPSLTQIGNDMSKVGKLKVQPPPKPKT
jgi:hypothetical protein